VVLWVCGSECFCRGSASHLSPVVIDRTDQVKQVVVLAAHPRVQGSRLRPVRVGRHFAVDVTCCHVSSLAF
jgi:hypothetical protein